MKKIIKISVLICMLLVISACSSFSTKSIATEDDKNNIITELNRLCERNEMVINEIIYIHKIDVSDEIYMHGSPEKIKTDAAYEMKIHITGNGKSLYLYDYFYFDGNYEKNYGISNNRETMTESDKFYFVDKNDNRLNYAEIDSNWIEENIMIYY